MHPAALIEVNKVLISCVKKVTQNIFDTVLREARYIARRTIREAT